MTTQVDSKLIVGPTGSGKTKRLLDRVGELILQHQVPADQILILSGTPGGAISLKNQLIQTMGEIASGVTATTVLAWGLSVLRAYYIYHHPNDQPFNVYSSDSEQLVHQFLARVTQNPSEEDYQTWLANSEAFDLNQVLEKTRYVLEHKDPILSLYPHRHSIIENAHHLTNPIAHDIVRHLGKKESVWISADPFLMTPAEFEQLQATFPQAIVEKTTETYRYGSGEDALAVLNPQIKTMAVAKSAKKTQLIFKDNQTPETQINWVVSTIQALKKSTWIVGSDIVIVFRENGQQLEQALHKANYDTLRLGENRFYMLPEIAIVIAYLRLIHNPYDHQALEKVALSLGISEEQIQSWMDLAFHEKQSVLSLCQNPKVTLEKKEELKKIFVHVQALQAGYYQNEHRIDALIASVKEVALQEDEHSNPDQIEDALANIDLLIEEIEEKGWTLQGVIDHAATLTEFDDPPPRGEAILLIEHRQVAILQDLHPHNCVILLENAQVKSDPETTYLAMGHSQQWIIYAGDSQEKNAWKSTLDSLGESLENLPKRPSLTVGDRVKHPQLGVAKILRIEGENEQMTLHLKFKSETKVLLAKYAQITKV